MKAKAWNVYGWVEDASGRHFDQIDTVFFDEDIPRSGVRRSLVNHDGYPPDIVVAHDGEDKDTAAWNQENGHCEYSMDEEDK